jgi:hypothetical protein
MLPPRYRALFVCLCLVAGGLAFAAVERTTQVRLLDTHGQTGLVWSLNSDPTTGAGLAAPQWQFLIRTDEPSLYYKSGTGNTAWTLLGSGGGASGTVTSVACGTNLSCSPSPITTTGTVATVASPTFTTVTAGEVVATSTTTSADLAGFANLETNLVNGPDQGVRLLALNGDPNGTVTAPKGSLLMDFETSGPHLYQNEDGLTTWLLVGESAPQAFYDTTINFGPVNTNTDNWNPGTLGQNTLIIAYDNGGHVTGLVGCVVGKIVTLQGPAVAAHGAVAVVQTTNEDSGSTATNRFLNVGATGSTQGVQGAHSWECNNVDGSGLRWHQIN